MVASTKVMYEYMNEHRNERKAQETYLEKYVFYGLENLNNGFDAYEIKYFGEDDFAIVLERVKQLKLGILGIEPWQNGEFYDVITYEMMAKEPTDACWYEKAFANFKAACPGLQYSATYFVPF